uniref:PPM-type phosphatase domain-containing protein n=1 Tax=Streptomyces sp. NBC_00003 TaxID=2903608 RepID=A0AAU2VAX3_9ACTN
MLAHAGAGEERPVDNSVRDQVRAGCGRAAGGVRHIDAMAIVKVT